MKSVCSSSLSLAGRTKSANDSLSMTGFISVIAALTILPFDPGTETLSLLLSSQRTSRGDVCLPPFPFPDLTNSLIKSPVGTG